MLGWLEFAEWLDRALARSEIRGAGWGSGFFSTHPWVFSLHLFSGFLLAQKVLSQGAL